MELYGVSLQAHLDAILAEWNHKGTIYNYPARKLYRGFEGVDLSVPFHDKIAATPLGPASGPHTQMVQNIILSFLGGGRIMELKTVQIMDRLEIPRPCIDVRNIGFNVEWSQELRLGDSYQEYLVAWILLKCIEELELLDIPKGDPFYSTVFDISVGYDLKGISSPEVDQWLRRIMNAEADIAVELEALPDRYAQLKNLKIDPFIADSATLSTFHGCPRDEIEAIVQHLIREHNLHVIVKMNPTIIGYEWVRKTLQDDLGYSHIELDPEAFEHDLQFDEGIEMIKRLRKFGADYGRNVGAKFTNTLVVKNGENVFSDEVMYLSGPPLHVISMNAMHRFREEIGADLHISFSAGINKHNFVDAVRCNMRPITTCTDLLKTGGYSRMFDYLKNLAAAMESSGTETIEAFLAAGTDSSKNDRNKSGHQNARNIVPALVSEPRYHHEKNKKSPPKVDSHLSLFDCLTCDKCIPVCPNAANFSIPIGELDAPAQNYLYQDGDFVPSTTDNFTLRKKAQIANLADFCNECGDCDTYCPEHGGPFVEKPRFFFTESSYNEFKKLDGFYCPNPNTLKGRIEGIEYLVSFNTANKTYLWQNGAVEFLLDSDGKLTSGMERQQIADGSTIDMQPFYIMKTLLDGLISDQDSFTSVLIRGTD